MGLFDKAKDPVFLKESSTAQDQLETLKELVPKLTAEGQKKIAQDIKLLEYGIQGEDQIAFELKNSHIPMYIIHDIYLEIGELNAQIDYMVFTRKMCFVLECKNLYGNIEINNNGDFVRTIEYNGHWKKEGIYSPITQNERHLELIRKLVCESKGNFLTRKLADHWFDGIYKSVIVLANPKTVLNAKYAKREIKEKVIRADQLIPFIKEQLKLSKEMAFSDAETKTWAESVLKHQKTSKTDYTEKYKKYLLSECEEQPLVLQEKHSTDAAVNTDNPQPAKICPRCGAPLILRTAKKGNFAGGQFYGCSSYPKCRYIENL